MLFNIAVVISIFMVFGFALLQLLLIFGAPFGEYVLGGQHKVLPKKLRFVSGGFSLVFTVVGTAFLQASGKISSLLNPLVLRIILIVYTGFLAYAIIGNGFITKSKKEKYIMTPCSIVGFLSAVVVLVNIFM